MTLTEQWKKGELEEGYYYVKSDWSDGVDIRYVHNGVDDWREITAPVPSYEEWKQLHKFLEEFNALDVAKENQQLKELLKYCHYYIINTPVYPQGDDAKQVEIHKLSDQITNAIGEK